MIHYSLKLGIASALFLTLHVKSQEKKLFDSPAYTLYSDKVVQGKYTAKAISPNEISSDYQSTASEIFSRKIDFKFSINEKDIELPSGKDHSITIGDEHASPVIVFGKWHTSSAKTNEKFLPANYQYTFRLDMRPVLQEFKEKGYYTAQDGTRIAKDDFKGVYIAGNATPLSWDFSNLDEKNLKLQDPDGDGIYEITLTLNPVDVGAAKNKSWKLTRDISQKPQYTSDQPIVDALFRMSTEESQMNIEADGTLRTGAKWSGVWTRDISYSILLSFAYLQPEEAKNSLMKKVKRDRIIQDTGSGGAWPVSTDRTTWALAAWEVYKTTGEESWLKSSFEILKNTIDDDFKTIYNAQTGLYRGESSFLDWREQTYPKWMDNRDIYVSENLGTNAVHYQAHQILVAMGKILKEDVAVYEKRAESLKTAINKNLWQEKEGFYAQYLYGRYGWLKNSDRFEALGEALTVLFDIANPQQQKDIVSKSPMTKFGTTNIFPQIPGIPPYHNNAVWPFVQSYFNLAAAKAGNENVLNFGLASVYRPAALFLTNYENYVAENGDYVGTEINSDRMLWSMAGNLSTVYRIFLGMNFSENGIDFKPTVPKVYGGQKNLKNFKYRKATLDIQVSGFGRNIKKFYLDGKETKNAFFPADLNGHHQIKIELDNQSFEGKINHQENLFSLPTPIVSRDKNTIKWEKIPNTAEYRIYEDGKLLTTTNTENYVVKNTKTADYQITAVDKLGYESFASEPLLFYPGKAIVAEIEDFTPKSSKPYINFSGKGFVEVSKTENKQIQLKINVPESGKYLLNFKYSNGNGAWNTDNRCAIRSLYINKKYEGVIVLPQRGQNEWSDWGNSNDLQVELKKGENLFTIAFEDWNNNMNVDENTAMLDYLQLIKL